MLHSMKFLLHFRKCYNGQIQCFNDGQENYWLLFCYFVVGITPTIILSDTLKFAVLKWGDRA